MSSEGRAFSIIQGFLVLSLYAVIVTPGISRMREELSLNKHNENYVDTNVSCDVIYGRMLQRLKSLI